MAVSAIEVEWEILVFCLSLSSSYAKYHQFVWVHGTYCADAALRAWGANTLEFSLRVDFTSTLVN